MRKLVLQKLEARYAGMSDYVRNLRNIVFQDRETMEEFVVSPNELIREVHNLSDLGKKYIVAQINQMSQFQP
jgi:hypothetical protein